jgi:uncharacterized MAPEG superfamily protein
VVTAHLFQADPAASSIAALVFVAARVLHAVFYILDQDKLRGLAFIVGLGCCIRLFLLAA